MNVTKTRRYRLSVDYNGKIKCKINISCLFVTEVVSLSGPQNRVNKLTTFWINPFPNRYVIKIAQSSYVIKGRFVGGGLREQCGKREDGRARMWCGGMRPGCVRV